MNKALFLGLITLVVPAVVSICGVSRADSVTSLAPDLATQGNWVGTYGSAGYILNGFNLTVPQSGTPAASKSNDVYSLPSYISDYSYDVNANEFLWASGQAGGGGSPGPLIQTEAQVNADIRDLTDPGNKYRKAATAYTNGPNPFILTMASNTPADFILSVYALDWDNIGRTEGITITAGASTTTQTISNFSGGEWLNFQITATAGETVEISNIAGQNAVISALAFEPVPEPSRIVALSGMCGMGLIGLIWRRR